MGAWGYDLFQSDHDFDIIDDLEQESGLRKLAADTLATAGRTSEEDKASICLTMYAPMCSDPELVKRHLESGVLTKLVKSREEKLLSYPGMFSVFNWTSHDPCYVYVLLGACAMTLGCRLSDSYLNLLKKVYTEGGLMPGALRQIRKALFGPNGFKNGEPYDFESKDLIETANSQDERPASNGANGFIFMNVPSPGGLFNTGMGDSRSSKVIAELRAIHNKANACGGCGAKHGDGSQPLLACSNCKHRKYCGVKCQKDHWKIHKKACQPLQE
ncbi:hypothetical protein BS50DRAFT_553370 [Corynespora cassiicola Philippines]|uniref:MYND-type domain-containing protein n=1 Tax=Corynespora cassiicola Philippines TaxID=1448308 RepID=A0A2T2NPN3_CORCC|nr:hypothetical protein BS50DRAFT_553370 [Corynespora cassiicola Philippines]